MILGSDFYNQSTLQTAQAALGKTFVRILEDGTRLSGIIVEVEAYLSSGDPASHSHTGRGKKNASMFLDPGTLYVYPIHAKHCANLVTEPKGQGAAILIRAVEPVEGIVTMHQSRFPSENPQSGRVEPRRMIALTQGPARWCQAFRIDRNDDGKPLARASGLWLEDAPESVHQRPWNMRTSPRIGISQARDLPLRFFMDGNRFVSGLARDHTRGRTWSFFHLAE